MRFVPAIEGIVPYSPGTPIEAVMRRFGLEEVVKLASNEFPLPPFAEVEAAVVTALDEVNCYPDADALDLRGALAGLTEAEREVLLLVAWDGLTPTEAAEALGLTAVAARSRLHRARTRAQATLANLTPAGL